MDQAPTSASSEAQAKALSDSWEAWETYYKEASRRRRSMGGFRGLREMKRRRRVRERIVMAASTALVLGLTLVFYIVLTR